MMRQLTIRIALVLALGGVLCLDAPQVIAQASSGDEAASKSRSRSRKSGPISLDALIIEEKLQIPVFLTLERHKPEFENLKMTKHFLDLIIKSVEKTPF